MPTSLAAPDIETIVIGGATIETHDAIAATEINIDLVHSTISVAFMSGTPANNSFIPGAQGAPYWVKINTLTGDWTSSLGTSGTLTGAQLTTINGNIKNARNGAEAIANALGVISGTFVAWT